MEFERGRPPHVQLEPDLLKHWSRVHDRRRRRPKRQARNPFWDQEREFLRDHTTQTCVDDVQLSFPCPANGIQQFDCVFRHFGDGIAHLGYGGGASATVVEDQGCVFSILVVSKVLRLPLPAILASSYAHNPDNVDVNFVRKVNGAAPADSDGDLARLRRLEFPYNIAVCGMSLELADSQLRHEGDIVWNHTQYNAVGNLPNLRVLTLCPCV